MKTIINGLRYDTATAILIGEAESDAPKTDFQYWEAGLYRTPRASRFFLAGHGGPMTRWAKNSWTGSARIFPLDHTEALAWAEEYLTQEEIAATIQDA